MSGEKFSTKGALHFGWDVFKAHSRFFIAVLAAVLLINLGLNTIGALVSDSAALSLLVGVVSWVLQVLISIGLLRIPLKFLDGQKAEFGDLVSGGRWFVNYLIASVLYALMVFGGLVLLIVPGIILGIRFQFFGYLIVDKNLSATEALKKSWAMTRSSVWDLFLLGVILTLLNLAGAMALMVGLFVSVPVTILAVAFVYRKLLRAVPESAPATA